MHSASRPLASGASNSLQRAGMQPDGIEPMRFTRPDAPLTPAAAYVAHCLARVVAQD